MESHNTEVQACSLTPEWSARHRVHAHRSFDLLSRPIGGSDDSCDLISWFFSRGCFASSLPVLLDVLSLVLCWDSDLLRHRLIKLAPAM
jgi:hypothetical protein